MTEKSGIASEAWRLAALFAADTAGKPGPWVQHFDEWCAGWGMSPELKREVRAAILHSRSAGRPR
jgi:hypothetical protein